MTVAVSAGRRRGLRRRALPKAVCGVLLLATAVGLALMAAGQDLGVPTPPFIMRWEPSLSVLVLVPLAVIPGLIALVPAIVARLPTGAGTAAVLFVLSVVLGLAVNLAHSGTRGWYGMFLFKVGSHASFEGHFEYLPGLPLLRNGIGWYLKHFAALYPQMPTHVKGNPPGPLIALHLLGTTTPQSMAALCVAVGSLCAPCAYAIGRELGDERRGRVAGLLTAFSPAVVLFGVTSADFAFAGLGSLAALLLLRGHASRGWLAAGAVAVAVSTFCSWLLLAIPAWAAIVVWRRHRLQAAVEVAVASVVGVLLLNGALALAYGYDPFSALRALHSAYVHGNAATRPYVFWLFGSPAAWAVMLGLPIVWFSLIALTEGDAAALALWAVIAVASVLGVTKAETERIWLPFVPLACVAAAAVPIRRLRLLLGALAAQALVITVLFFTVW